MEATPSPWPLAPLGELCRIELGSTPPRKSGAMWDADKATDNVWLTIADLPKNLHASAVDSNEYVSELAAANMRKIPVGTLLVSFKLTLGRLAYAGRDLFSNEAIASLLEIDDRRIQDRFLYWALSAFDWDKAAEGDQKIKGKTLNKAKLKRIPVPLPPLEEQRRIVAVLDEVFEGLDRARAHAEANLQNVWNLLRGIEDSLLSPTPSTPWVTDRIKNCLKVKSGDFLPRNRMASEGSIPVYGGNGRAGQHDKSNLFGENLLIGRVGAKCGNIHRVSEPIWLTDNALYVCEKRRNFDDDFLGIILERAELRKTANQAAQPVISYRTIGPVELTFPTNLSEQKRIVAEYAERRTNCRLLAEAYNEQLASLDNLRQSILQRAFAGELT